MLANSPNGKVAEALAQIYTKEDISLVQEKDFSPTVYVAKVSCCSMALARTACVILRTVFAGVTAAVQKYSERHHFF